MCPDTSIERWYDSVKTWAPVPCGDYKLAIREDGYWWRSHGEDSKEGWNSHNLQGSRHTESKWECSTFSSHRRKLLNQGWYTAHKWIKYDSLTYRAFMYCYRHVSHVVDWRVSLYDHASFFHQQYKAFDLWCFLSIQMLHIAEYICIMLIRNFPLGILQPITQLFQCLGSNNRNLTIFFLFCILV